MTALRSLSGLRTITLTGSTPQQYPPKDHYGVGVPESPDPKAISALKVVSADLAAEHADLDRLVATLDDADWDRETPAVGWAVRDQISHLAYFDDAATLALRDPEAFVPISRAVTEATEAGEDPMREHLVRGRSLQPAELLWWWRDARRKLLEAASLTDPAARIPWFGPPMGARSFLSARIMEVWAHGQDVADCMSVERSPTDRLRHVAHLGVGARPFSYVIRSLEPPVVPVRVELSSPRGEIWEWGPSDSSERVSGPALDFCLAVTRRRPLSATGLVVSGELAREWMDIAQSFAGPPGPDRPAPQLPRS
jgi:uncharacterized protein (TIGR03084 family)